MHAILAWLEIDIKDNEGYWVVITKRKPCMTQRKSRGPMCKAITYRRACIHTHYASITPMNATFQLTPNMLLGTIHAS